MPSRTICAIIGSMAIRVIFGLWLKFEGLNGRGYHISLGYNRDRLVCIFISLPCPRLLGIGRCGLFRGALWWSPFVLFMRKMGNLPKFNIFIRHYSGSWWGSHSFIYVSSRILILKRISPKQSHQDLMLEEFSGHHLSLASHCYTVSKQLKDLSTDIIVFSLPFSFAYINKKLTVKRHVHLPKDHWTFYKLWRFLSWYHQVNQQCTKPHLQTVS